MLGALALKYSERLGEISDEQLQAAADESDLGVVVSSAPISSGLFGQNLMFDTDRGSFVLRGKPHYEWQLPTESYFAERLHEATSAPVPWPYRAHPTSSIFAWSWGYAIMPRLPGSSLADPAVYHSLSPHQLRELAVAQGELLAEVHRLSSSEAGSYEPASGAVAAFPNGYIGRTVQVIESCSETARRNGAHDRQAQSGLQRIVETLASGDDAPSFCAVMEDFNRNNMVADTGAGFVKITGLFDLMTFHYGDGLADLPRQFAMYTEEADGAPYGDLFVASYMQAAAVELDGPALQRALLYLLADRLLVWEYFHRPGHSGGPWPRDASLLEWLAPYLERFETALRLAGG